MNIGISSSCLFPMYTEKALELLFKNDVKNVELFLNTHSECNKEYTRLFKKIVQEYGGVITSVHPCTSESEGVNFFGRYERRFDDYLDSYKRLFEFCNELGTDILVFHGARTMLPISDATYFERYERLSTHAAKQGVLVCQENVVNFKAQSPAFIKKMRKAVPNTSFVLDIKQAVRAGEDPFEILDAMGENLQHVHISDHNKDNDCLSPMNGDFDWENLIKKLHMINYSKNMIIELYRQNFQDISELIESEKKLNKIAAKLCE